MKSLLIVLIGNDFGPDPEQKVAGNRESRQAFANQIADQTKVTSSDVLLDLGSGCGFGTFRLAERAAWVHACDVSSAYLNFAKRTCAEQKNVSYHLIEPHNLTGISDQSIDVAISMSVFIHFNLYDIYWYFREQQRVVKPTGRLWIDVADADAVRPNSPNWQTEHFLIHARGYRENPSSISGLIRFPGNY